MLIQPIDLRQNGRPSLVSLLNAMQSLTSLLTFFAVACFYIRFTSGNTNTSQDYYRAIYLTERTARDLMQKISGKHNVDSTRISTILHVNQKGMRVLVDDDVVRELPEGQDILVDISEASGSNASDPGTSGPPIEMRLTW